MPSLYSQKTKAMTLIEVLIALSIVSFVFSSLSQMTFDSLKRTKKLELQDKMRNYATEAVQILYNSKDTDWNKTFSENEGVLPPAVTNASDLQLVQGYIRYDSAAPTIDAIRYGDCSYDKEEKVLVGTNCAQTASNETETLTNKRIFGRLIIRRDDNSLGSNINEKDTQNDAEIEIIVACIQGRCSGTDYAPFQLSFNIYRTGGAQ